LYADLSSTAADRFPYNDDLINRRHKLGHLQRSSRRPTVISLGTTVDLCSTHSGLDYHCYGQVRRRSSLDRRKPRYVWWPESRQICARRKAHYG